MRHDEDHVDDEEIVESIRHLQQERSTKLVVVVLGLVATIGVGFLAVYLAYSDQPQTVREINAAEPGRWRAGFRLKRSPDGLCTAAPSNTRELVGGDAGSRFGRALSAKSCLLSRRYDKRPFTSAATPLPFRLSGGLLMRSWNHLVSLVLTMCLAVVLGGCGMGRYMKPVQNPQPIAAPADAAVVVFVHPQVAKLKAEPIIMDDQGRYLGTSIPGSQFAVSLAPGEHYLIAWGDDSRALHATLAAGRIYYVSVEPEPGVTAPVLGLFAVRPDSSRWQTTPQSLAQTTRYEPDLTRGQIALKKRQADQQGAISRAKHALSTYDPAQKAARTLAAEHGLTAPTQPGAPAPQPAGAAQATEAAPQPAPTAAEEPPPQPPPAPEPLVITKMMTVGDADPSGRAHQVVSEGAINSEGGVKIEFWAKPENFGEKFVGYTYAEAGVNQLTGGDSLLLFVVGVQYRQINLEGGAPAEFEDAGGALARAPEDWAGAHLNGAWVQVTIDRVQQSDAGVVLDLTRSLTTTAWTTPRRLEFVKAEGGYTIKPLIRTRAQVYRVPEVSASRAKRKVGIFALKGNAFTPASQEKCATQAKIVGVDDTGPHAEGDIATVAGKPALFCVGAKHEWSGTLTFAGYTIQSDAAKPLQFSVHPTKGYVYTGGVGRVTLPNGRNVDLR